MSKLPIHTSILGYRNEDNRLYVGKMDVADYFLGNFERPCYMYFRELIDTRIAHLRDSFPSAVRLHYAIKANPYPDLVKHVAGLVDGLDVASRHELSIARSCDLDPINIGFAGPGKSVIELDSALEMGVILNVESTTELTRIAAIAERTGRQPLIAIRVNPEFQLKAAGMKMSGGPSPFGIDSERVPETIALAGDLGLKIIGFHIFCGSQSLDEDAICETHKSAFDLALRLSESMPEPPRHLNLGGGLGIPYFSGERPLALDSIGANLGSLSGQLESEFPEARLVIELGRYLVGEAGLYLCRVIDRKESRGSVFVVVDGGLHHHLAASGNFGQILRKNYPVAVINKLRGRYEEKANVVGPLCTPLDVLASGMKLGHAEIGDVIGVFQSGAYGFSASPHGFLSHPAPSECLL